MKARLSLLTGKILDFLERHRRFRYLVLSIPSIVLIISFFLIPILFVLRISFCESSPILNYIPGFTLDSYIRFFQKPFYTNLLLVGFKLGIATVIPTFLLGYPTAYVIWRGGRKKSVLLSSCVIFSLFVNIIIREYGWLVILGRFGIFSYLLQVLNLSSEPVSFTYSFPAVVVGLISECLPYMVLTLVAVLKSIDWGLVEAARDLGAGRLRSFYEVILPLSMPGIVAGTSLVFIWSVGAFVTPTILGSASEKTLACEAETKILRVFDWPFGAAIAFILVLFLFVTLVFYQRFTKRSGGAT